MLDPGPRTASPAFDVHLDARGTTQTVTVIGELDLAARARFAAAVDAALVADAETVLIDLSAVSFVDSTAIHAVLRAHARAQERGVRLVLIPAPALVQRAFALCGVEAVLPFVGARPA